MTIIKVDIDVKVPSEWLIQWIETRLFLLRSLGYSVISYSVYESAHGYHIYFNIAEDVDRVKLVLIQFLLGDDHKRVYFNLSRLAWGDDSVSNRFDILFDTIRRRRISFSDGDDEALYNLSSVDNQ